MTKVYWNFRLRVESKTLIYTRDILEKIKNALDKEADIHSYEIEEEPLFG